MQMLAGLDRLSFQLVKSLDKRPDGKLNLMIRQRAVQTAEQAGPAPALDAPAVMRLSIEAAPAGTMATITMTGEVDVRGTDPKAKPIPIWKHQEVVGEVSQQALRCGDLSALLRTGVGRFFEQFLRDRRLARGEAR